MSFKSERRLCRFARWALLIVFCGAGATCLSWAFQDADFSVPADPVMSQIYVTRAILLFPISILFFAVGVLFFLCIRCPRSEENSQ